MLHYPGPQSFEKLMEQLSSAFGVSAKDVAASVVREFVGETAWPAVRDAMNAAAQLRTEPVLLTSPRVLVFR